MKCIFNSLNANTPIIVSGSSGLIGAYLTRRLVTAVYKVNLLLQEQSKTWRIDTIMDNTTIHRVDLIHAKDVERVV